MCASLLKGENTLENILISTTMWKTSETLTKKKVELSAQSKTSQLAVVRISTDAQHCTSTNQSRSHWFLVESFERCLQFLPIFAAAGHFNYFKSVYLHIQDMTDLDSKHPLVYAKLIQDYHAFIRANKSILGWPLLRSSDRTNAYEVTERQRWLDSRQQHDGTIARILDNVSSNNVWIEHCYAGLY